MPCFPQFTVFLVQGYCVFKKEHIRVFLKLKSKTTELDFFLVLPLWILPHYDRYRRIFVNCVAMETLFFINVTTVNPYFYDYV
jgi:hypothetical protein